MRNDAILVIFSLGIPFVFSCSSIGEETEDVAYATIVKTVYVRSAFSNTRLLKSPPWREMAENPPLTARRAKEITDTQIEKVATRLALAPDEGFAFRQLSLVPLLDNRWIWVGRYELSRGISLTGGYVEIVVLMDGNVVSPTFSMP
jgi:hypothetical protein